MKACLSIFCLCSLFLSNISLHAQETSPRDELLALVPADSGFCLVVQQLRGQVEKWQQSAWVQGLRESPLGQALRAAPEWQNLVRLQEELKKRLELDWGTIRDDILGDAVVFAYRPPLPGNVEHEQGLLLVHARRPELLAKLIDRLNQEQKKSGELKLTLLEHRGVKYQRRVDARSSHFVLVDGPLFALSGRENLIKGLIEQRQVAGAATEKNVILHGMNRAGSERAVLALWVNPRAFEAELEQRAQKDAGPEGVMLRTFLAYWKPLESIVIAASAENDVAVKLTVQARTKELPSALRKLFTDSPQPSELWSRFPSNALLTLADRADLGLLSESVGDFSTPKNSKRFLDAMQKTVGAILGLDLAKDVLPNLGPDWGLCIAAAEEPGHFPHILAALAVKPGSGDLAVDQGLFKGVQFFANLAVFDYNRKNPQPLRLKSLVQDKVEVRYLDGDKVFPAGFQPACALKDGYLLFASSPEAILRFRTQGPMPAVKEVPVLRLSTTELARLVRVHRKQVTDYLAEKNQVTSVVASQGLESVLGVFDLVDHITILQNSGGGQASWVLRVRAKQP